MLFWTHLWSDKNPLAFNLLWTLCSRINLKSFYFIFIYSKLILNMLSQKLFVYHILQLFKIQNFTTKINITILLLLLLVRSRWCLTWYLMTLNISMLGAYRKVRRGEKNVFRPKCNWANILYLIFKRLMLYL